MTVASSTTLAGTTTTRATTTTTGASTTSTSTTTAPGGQLPDLAPPVVSADVPAFTGIAQVRIGDTCTGTLLDTGVASGPAYVLTNGHCAEGRNIGANEVVTDEAHGLKALPIAAQTPTSGDAVVNVGVPVQGTAQSSDQVLRRGACRLGDQVDLLEFTWHFDAAWSNDCPGIRGGSSGSPLLDSSGAIVAMINTTTAGAPPDGGDCGLGKPCERRPAGLAVVADRSYAVPVVGLRDCFSAGIFAMGGTDGSFTYTVPTAEGVQMLCVAASGNLDRASEIVVDVDDTPPQRIPQLSVMASPGEVRFEPIFSVPELSDFTVKFGPPATTDCADPAGYVRYRRVAFRIEAAELPAKVCVIGFDDAGNAGAPFAQTITG